MGFGSNQGPKDVLSPIVKSMIIACCCIGGLFLIPAYWGHRDVEDSCCMFDRRGYREVEDNCCVQYVLSIYK
jgi:hypothetical protein